MTSAIYKMSSRFPHSSLQMYILGRLLSPHFELNFDPWLEIKNAFKVFSRSGRSHPPLQFPSGLWTWGLYRDLKLSGQWRHFPSALHPCFSQLLPALSLKRSKLLNKAVIYSLGFILPPESRSWLSRSILRQRGSHLLIDLFIPTRLFISFSWREGSQNGWKEMRGNSMRTPSLLLPSGWGFLLFVSKDAGIFSKVQFVDNSKVYEKLGEVILVGWVS